MFLPSRACRWLIFTSLRLYSRHELEYAEIAATTIISKISNGLSGHVPRLDNSQAIYLLIVRNRLHCILDLGR